MNRTKLKCDCVVQCAFDIVKTFVIPIVTLSLYDIRLNSNSFLSDSSEGVNLR